MKTLETILNSLPGYAKDIKLNLSSLTNNHQYITDEQFYGVVLASAFASKNQELITAANNTIANQLDHTMLNGVKAAASIMAMTNIYYRFTDLVNNENYIKMSAGLRMNIIREHGVNNVDFEMWCLAVSIINGCSMCVSSHEKQLVKQHNISPEAIQLIAKISAVIHALARTIETSNI
jgi:alkyl hydroperoxide reductase subunit D